jgi:hypothetical protein
MKSNMLCLIVGIPGACLAPRIQQFLVHTQYSSFFSWFNFVGWCMQNKCNSKNSMVGGGTSLHDLLPSPVCICMAWISLCRLSASGALLWCALLHHGANSFWAFWATPFWHDLQLPQHRQPTGFSPVLWSHCWVPLWPRSFQRCCSWLWLENSWIGQQPLVEWDSSRLWHWAWRSCVCGCTLLQANLHHHGMCLCCRCGANECVNLQDKECVLVTVWQVSQTFKLWSLITVWQVPQTFKLWS